MQTPKGNIPLVSTLVHWHKTLIENIETKLDSIVRQGLIPNKA